MVPLHPVQCLSAHQHIEGSSGSHSSTLIHTLGEPKGQQLKKYNEVSLPNKENEQLSIDDVNLLVNPFVYFCLPLQTDISQ